MITRLIGTHTSPMVAAAPNTGTPLGIMEKACQEPELQKVDAQIATARQMLDQYARTAPSAENERGRAMSEYGIFALCFPMIGAMFMASHIAPVIGAIPAMSLILVGPCLGMLLVRHIGNQRARDKQESYEAGRRNLENQVAQNVQNRDKLVKAAAERLWLEAQARQAAGQAQQPTDATLEQSHEAVTINGVRVERKSEG